MENTQKSTCIIKYRHPKKQGDITCVSMVFHIVILSYGMSDNEPVISKYCRLFDLFIELTFRCSEMCKGIPKGNVYHNTAHGSPQNRVTFLVMYRMSRCNAKFHCTKILCRPQVKWIRLHWKFMSMSWRNPNLSQKNHRQIENCTNELCMNPIHGMQLNRRISVIAPLLKFSAV